MYHINRQSDGAENFLGIDIGGTNIKLGVVSASGKVRCTKSLPTGKTYPAILQQLVDAAAMMRKEHSYSAVGVGVPAPVKEDGTLAACVNIPIDGYPILKDLTDAIALPVYMANDADCAALAEYRIGAGKGHRHILLLTLGTGVGSGMVIDGKLFSGNDGYFELGHMITHAGGRSCSCGRRGCMEQYASASALKYEVSKAVRQYPESVLASCAKDLDFCIAAFEAVGQGCCVAKEILDRFFEDVSIGITNAKWMFSPELVILGGGMAAQGDALLEPIAARVGDIVPVALAELGNQAGLIGASMLCIRQ